MKRGFFIVLLFLIALIPSANALVEMGDFTKEKYNIGDKVNIDVKVELNKDFVGYFYIKLVCSASTSTLMTKILDLETNQEVFLEETVSIPDYSGSCKFLAELKNEESDESKSFTITKDLVGTFQIDKDEIQLGQRVKLTGQILRSVSQTNVEGKAKLLIRNGGEIIDEESFVDVDDGVLTYTYDADNVPQGSYLIDVYVFDILGNEMSFGNVTKFDVTGVIDVDLTTDKQTVLPGEEVKIDGTVKYKQNSGVSGIKITVNEESVVLNDLGGFSYTKLVPKDAKTGETVLTITAKDNAGNFGEKTFTYTVTAVPTTVALYVPQEEVLPGDKVEASASLFDQAGDKMDGEVNIQIYDKSSNILVEGEGNVEYTIKEFTPPGIINVKATYQTLLAEDEFSIGEKQDFEATVTSTGILIRNKGNVKFDGEIEFLTGTESSYEKVNLGIDETKAISLEDRAGTYVLTVTAAGHKMELGEVTIVDQRNVFSRLTSPLTGNVAGVGGEGTSLLGYMLVALVMLVFIAGFYFLKVRDMEKLDLSRERERREAKTFKEQILKQREDSKRKTFGREISPDEAKKFREQFLRNVKQTEVRDRNHRF